MWLSGFGVIPHTDQRVTCSIVQPGQSTRPGCRPGPWWGACKRHLINVSLPLSPSLPLSLKVKHIKSLKKKRNRFCSLWQISSLDKETFWSFFATSPFNTISSKTFQWTEIYPMQELLSLWNVNLPLNRMFVSKASQVQFTCPQGFAMIKPLYCTCMTTRYIFSH